MQRLVLETSHWISHEHITDLLSCLGGKHSTLFIQGTDSLKKPGDNIDLGNHYWWQSDGPSGQLAIRVTSRTRSPWEKSFRMEGYDLTFTTEDSPALAAMAAAIWVCWGPTTPLSINGGEAEQAFRLAHKHQPHLY